MPFFKFANPKRPIREQDTVPPPDWFKRYALSGTDVPSRLFLKYVGLDSIDTDESLNSMNKGTRNTVYGTAMAISFKDTKEFRNNLEKVSDEVNTNCIDIEEEQYLDLAEPGLIGADKGVLSRLRTLKKYSALTELGVSPYAMRILEIDNLTSLAVICAVDQETENPLIFILSSNSKSLTSPNKIASKNASWQTPYGYWRTIN